MSRPKRKHSHGDHTLTPTLASLHQPSASTTASLSNDGRCVHQESRLVAPPSPLKRQRSGDRADWLGQGFEDAFIEGGDERADEVVVELEQGKKKAKRYLGSDHPHLQWLPHRQEYLEETIRFEGIGGFSTDRCAYCSVASAAMSVIQCRDCFSGGDLMCASCCAVRLHFILFRSGTELSLKRVIVQLGHRSGQACANPRVGHKNFTVIHSNGLHIVNLQFCQCTGLGAAGSLAQQLLRREWYPATDTNPRTACTFRVLELFHLQTLQGKGSAYDFYLGLEQLSDNTGASSKLRRYKEFLRCSRQHRHLAMLRRAGQAHDDSGAAGTKPGELVVICPACPHPDVNLPAGWDLVDADKRFLYFLFICIDACFRMKRRIVSNGVKDPSLSGGSAYFIEDAPYRRHLLKYTDQHEMSTCSGLSALDHANTKFSQGYASTGVGVTVCARHEFVEANRVGDLQKGERYANMDYIFASGQRHHDKRLRRVGSYDISCQWLKNLWERMKNLPPHIRLNFDPAHLKFVIPKLHLYSHKVACHVLYSLNLLPGAGQTDGEAVERSHSKTNPATPSTVQCGPGLRWDILNDLWGFQNYLNTIHMGAALKKKLINAIPERNAQIESFDAFSSKQTAHVDGWLKMIVEWEDGTLKKNPYVLPKSGLTQADIHHQLFQEEADLAESGVVALHEVSPVSFVIAGLELEEQQRRLRLSIRHHPAMTVHQNTYLLNLRTKLSRGITRFRSLQAAYMPISIHILAQQLAHPQGQVEQPEDIPLLLPSALNQRQLDGGCTPSLVNTEHQLHDAQCRSSLEYLRNHLHIKSRLITHKGLHVRHQGPNTRARALIRRNDEKIHQLGLKYQMAREAFLSLGGSQAASTWEELKDEDVRCMEDSEELEKRAICEEKRQACRQRLLDGNQLPGDGAADEYVPPVPKTPVESRRTISWLWWAAGDSSDGNEDLVNGLRVEWAKAYARKRRWTEEVLLIKEEMRRMLEFHKYKANWWKERRARLTSPSSEIFASGAHAYASHQAHLHLDLVKRFTALWSEGSNIPSLNFDSYGVTSGLTAEVEDEGGESDEDDFAEDVVEESDVYM